MVNTTPAATDSPAEPIVWTMLFSRIVEPPRRFSTEIASTAIGIEALTVRPARRPRYTVEAPNRRPKSAPSTIALSGELGGRLRRRNVRLERARIGGRRGVRRRGVGHGRRVYGLEAQRLKAEGAPSLSRIRAPEP